MSLRTLYDIEIGGRNVSLDIAPILLGLTVNDGSDNEADTANIELEDSDGLTFISRERDPVLIRLGTRLGMGTVFQGFVDEVRSVGDRNAGRSLTIACKSVDTAGPSKAPLEKHWEDKTLQEILKDAFSQTGITVKVSPELASIVREYEAMDAEDPLSFAARLAREVGGTFKMMGQQAVLTKRNSGAGTDGLVMPTFDVIHGQNLLEWDLVPIISRASFSTFRNSWFDFDKNKLVVEEEKSTGKVPYSRPGFKARQSLAKEKSGADKIDADRKSGEGSVTVLGSYLPQAEGQCRVQGVRDGVDGTYIISSLEHSLTRSSGWVTTLEVKRPEGGAGVDTRIPTPTPAPR